MAKYVRPHLYFDQLFKKHFDRAVIVLFTKVLSATQVVSYGCISAAFKRDEFKKATSKRCL